MEQHAEEAADEAAEDEREQRGDEERAHASEVRSGGAGVDREPQGDRRGHRGRQTYRCRVDEEARDAENDRLAQREAEQHDVVGWDLPRTLLTACDAADEHEGKHQAAHQPALQLCRRAEAPAARAQVALVAVWRIATLRGPHAGEQLSVGVPCLEIGAIFTRFQRFHPAEPNLDRFDEDEDKDHAEGQQKLRAQDAIHLPDEAVADGLGRRVGAEHGRFGRPLPIRRV